MLPLRDSLEGTLLGTALGDALGLPAEGLKPRTIERRFGSLERFSLIGRTGFVSDDTEQTFLVLQSALRGGADETRIVQHFKRALVGWFWRLPFGIGLATLRACVKATLGLRHSGVNSAGNGAAMRAPVLGVALREMEETRVDTLSAALARVTHTDVRAVEGAVFATRFARQLSLGTPAPAAARHALTVVTDESLRAAIERAVKLGESAEVPEALTTGFVLHSVPWAVCCTVRHASAPMEALRMVIRGGGDTDTNAAMVGAWLGAAHGPSVWPAGLVQHLAGGPFGVAHGRALAHAAVSGGAVPGYAWPLALLRNLALYPVVLAHGFRRLWPW